MTLSVSARRCHAARAIRVSLAEAEAERAQLDQGDNPDRSTKLDAMIDSLRDRLNKRRFLVLEARNQSLARGLQNRQRRFRPVVWGFPTTYNPNHAGDRCPICRNILWKSRPTDALDLLAWSCRNCSPNHANAAQRALRPGKWHVPPRWREAAPMPPIFSINSRGLRDFAISIRMGWGGGV